MGFCKCYGFVTATFLVCSWLQVYSVTDVAVGAPQEDEGVGAVYIYLGGSKGPSQSYSQRISGQLLKKGLLSFGTHISQPISNLSAYPGSGW